MTEKQKSKKQVAREYFSSLDNSLPLRDRVDQLVEYMKIQFVNGQTERVIFSYIRDDIPKEILPKTSGILFTKIVKHKVDQVERKSDSSSHLGWDQDSGGKVIDVLMLVDLYSNKMEHHLLGDFSTNSYDINSMISSEEFDSAEREWISKYCSGKDLLKNYFPFHSKDQLESPIDGDDLIDIARYYLGEGEVEVFNHVMSGGRSYKAALNYLEHDYYYELDHSDTNVVQSSESDPAAYDPVVRNSGSNGKGAIFFTLLLAFAIVIYLVVKPGSDASEVVTAAAVDVTQATSNINSNANGYENSSPYSGSSPSTRDSMNYEQREKYDNLSPEGKASIDDQMKQYDEYCSNSSDC